MALETASGAADRVAIVLHSGSYDRASYALSLAIVALAIGRPVYILLTYGGLLRFTRRHLEDMDEDTPAAIGEALERGLARGGIVPLAESLANAKRLGLKLYACANAMAVLNISRDELIDEVDEVVGLVTFMKFAHGAAINWYI